MNGFADYIKTELGEEKYALFKKGLLTAGLNEAAVPNPSQTIVFGEKTTESNAWWLDLLKPNGAYLDDLAESRHGNPKSLPRIGFSNAAMADGSVASLPFGKSTCPENIWAVLAAVAH